MIFSKYNFIIWDFHGTMTDHQLRMIRSYNRAGQAAFGHGFDQAFFQQALTRPAHQTHDGNGLSHNEFILEYFGQLSHFQSPTDVARFIQLFHQEMKQTYIAIPGIIPTVKKLHQAGIEMAVATNKSDKSTIKEILNKWNLSFLAERVYNQQDSGVRKPHPEALFKILRDMELNELKVSPETSLLVGDYITDIHGAAAVGMDSVLIASGSPGISFKLKEPFPTFVIAEPKELLAIVAGETKPELTREVTIGQTLWKNEAWSIYKEK